MNNTADTDTDRNGGGQGDPPAGAGSEDRLGGNRSERYGWDRVGSGAGGAHGGGAPGLGDTRTVNELIPGEPQACHDYATALAAEGQTGDEVFNALKRVRTQHWSGDAADSFHARLASLARFVAAHAGDAERGAATVDDYAHRLGAAQGKAADAIMFANAADKMVDRVNRAYATGGSVDPDALYTIRVEHDKALATLAVGHKIKGDAVLDATRKIGDTRADLTAAAKKLPTYHPGEAATTSPLTGKTTGAPPPHPPRPLAPRSWAPLDPGHPAPPTLPSAAGGGGGAVAPPTLPSAAGGGSGGQSGGYSSGLNGSSGHPVSPPTLPSATGENGNPHSGTDANNSNGYGYGYDQPGPRGPFDPYVRPLGLAPDARPYLLPNGRWLDTPGTLPASGGAGGGWTPLNTPPAEVLEPPPLAPPAASVPPWQQVPQTTPPPQPPPAVNPAPPPAAAPQPPAPQPPPASSGANDGALTPRAEHRPHTLPDPSSTGLTVPGDPGSIGVPGAEGGQPQPPVDPTPLPPAAPTPPTPPTPATGIPGANGDGPASWSSQPATEPAGAGADRHRSDSGVPWGAIGGAAGGVAIVGGGGVLGARAVKKIGKSVERNRIQHRRGYQPGSGRRGDLPDNTAIGLRIEAAGQQAKTEERDPTTGPAHQRPTRRRHRPATRPNPQTGPTQPPSSPSVTPPGQPTPGNYSVSNDGSFTSPQVLAAAQEDTRRNGAEQAGAASEPAAAVLVVGQFTATGQRADIQVHNTGGIGIHGDNAPAVVRAMILEVLSEDGRVIIPRRDAVELLDTTELDRIPHELHIVPELEDALEVLDDVLNHNPARTGDNRENGENGAAGASEALTLLILAHAPSHPGDSKELGQLLLRATDRPVTALIIGGGWASGHSFGINDDNYVTATRGASTEHLHGAYAYNFPAHATVGALAQLAPPSTSDTSTDETDQLSTDQVPTRADIAIPPGDLIPNLDAYDDSEHDSDSDSDDRLASDDDPETTASDEDEATADGEPSTLPASRPAETEPSDDIVHAAHAASVADPPEPAAGDRGEGVLTLDVLGPPRLCWTVPAVDPGKPATVCEIPVHSSRCREVLVYLALHPDGVTREKIAADVWASDIRTERPTNAVNTVLSRLRKLITTKTVGAVTLPLITLGTGRCKLDPDVFRVDYWNQVTALKERLHTDTAVQRIPTYRQILANYRGEFGEGLTGEWIEAPRQDVLRDVVDVATHLADTFVKNGEPDQALDVLERVRQADKYNEPIYQQIIQLQASLGRQDAATRTYELLRTNLAEVDTEPLPSTTDIIGDDHTNDQ
ncbi:AfsR/SARP family transcriptional regulator [Pseudonocardia sp. Cha107L01]|uniref:AfsR/SARP family transcriptional regulator n=1 Tax=Pseudonocardia sp. Cha107L01 TaxID=3457576 RepID=UPI00403EB046